MMSWIRTVERLRAQSMQEDVDAAPSHALTDSERTGRGWTKRAAPGGMLNVGW
jgi:hypothetical protein